MGRGVIMTYAEWEKYGHQANQLPVECSINIGTAQHWITRNYHYPLAVASLQDTAQAYNANGIAIRSGIRWRGCPASGIR